MQNNQTNDFSNSANENTFSKVTNDDNLHDNPSNNSDSQESKNSILSPKLDVIFQILFGEVGSENITKDLLSTILDEEINEIDLDQNIVLRRNFPKDKMGVVDVLAKINNNEYCNIEMQVTDYKDIVKRMIFYWSRQYSKKKKKSGQYIELKRTICVLIANFSIDELKDLGSHTQWKIIETKNRKKILTDDFELHIIDLTKMRKEHAEGKDKKLKEWLCFLDNPESKEVLEFMKDNENIKQAKEKLVTMSEDETIRRLAELREKALLDEREAEYTGYCKGKEEGHALGLSEGRTLGIKDNKKEIAKKMKEKGYDINSIIEITNLSKEEIEKL